ncbi:unnamed protein product [Rotaria magnacalcarata]|nr:unnamed protein product [Rotaria magnacalcarata]
MTYATGGGSVLRYTVADDMNDDGHLDIVVANYGTNDVGILFGLGNGAFLNQMIFNTGSSSHPSCIALGYFNRDTQLDFAAAYDGIMTVEIFLGSRNGTFARQVSDGIRFVSTPLFIASGDMNGDGISEIVVAYDDNDNVDLLVTYNNVSFENQMTFSTDHWPSSVVVSDFNNGTRLDIVVANVYGNDVSVLLGYDNGSFQNQMTFSTGSYSLSLAVSDFNNDTRLDIVVANQNDKNVSVLLGYGNGTFQNQMTFSSGAGPYSVAVGDFNNDTQLDIVVANLAGNDVSVLLGFIVIGFMNQSTITAGNGSRPQSVAIADFNNDSRMDVAVANSGSHTIAIFLGYGNFTFSNQTTFSAGSKPMSIAVGDFNNDSRSDIAVANYDSETISIFLGYGNGCFSNQSIYSTGPESYPYFVAVEDFNNDTAIDIVVITQGTNNLGIFLGYGNGTFSNVTVMPMGYGSDPFCVLIGDFNNDRKLDFAVANEGTDSLSMFLQTC